MLSEERLVELEVKVVNLTAQLKEERDAVKPILDFWNAGKIIGKALVILGGIIVGAAAVVGPIMGWLERHWK